MTERHRTHEHAPDRGRTAVLATTAAVVVVTGAMLIGANTPVTAVDTGGRSGGVELQGVEAQAVRVAREKPRLSECEGWVGLTFDDGPVPGPWGTAEVVRVLDRLDVPGTFFMLGREMAEHRGEVKGVLRAGGEVGNGTWDHPDLRGLTESQVNQQLRRTQRVYGRIARSVGKRGEMRLWRPPYGAVSKDGVLLRARQEAAARVARRMGGERLGMTETLWTVDPRNHRRMTVGEVVRGSRGMTDGGILTLQEGRATTVKALPRIVRHYWKQGLCFGVLRNQGAGWFQTPQESPALQFSVKAVKPRRY